MAFENFFLSLSASLLCPHFKTVGRHFRSPIILDGKPNTGIPAANIYQCDDGHFLLTDYRVGETFGVFNFNLAQFNKSIQELQETCFQDILNPTENELILFELQYGFEWPLQLCCEPIAHGLNPQPLTGDMNEIT